MEAELTLSDWLIILSLGFAFYGVAKWGWTNYGPPARPSLPAKGAGGGFGCSPSASVQSAFTAFRTFEPCERGFRASGSAFSSSERSAERSA